MNKKIMNTWRQMIDRCHNPASRSYSAYGKRGIAVCKRWRNSLEAFAKDMGEPPSPQHSIDRVDNSRGYSPENCRWATPKEQARNTRRNRILTVDGVAKPMAEWAEIYGVSPLFIQGRLNMGWSHKDAVTKPKVIPGEKPRKGAAHPRALLSEGDAKYIKQNYRHGRGGNTYELVARFGVSRDTIRNIGLGKSWRHL